MVDNFYKLKQPVIQAIMQELTMPDGRIIEDRELLGDDEEEGFQLSKEAKEVLMENDGSLNLELKKARDEKMMEQWMQEMTHNQLFSDDRQNLSREDKKKRTTMRMHYLQNNLSDKKGMFNQSQEEDKEHWNSCSNKSNSWR